MCRDANMRTNETNKDRLKTQPACNTHKTQESARKRTRSTQPQWSCFSAMWACLSICPRSLNSTFWRVPKADISFLVWPGLIPKKPYRNHIQETRAVVVDSITRRGIVQTCVCVHTPDTATSS